MPKIMKLIAILFKPEFKDLPSCETRDGITLELTGRDEPPMKPVSRMTATLFALRLNELLGDPLT
jgi:hypothetical protein